MPGLAALPADEKSLLLGYLAQQRDGIRNAAYGLTDEQARLAPTAGTLTIGGLLKHVAAMERHWIDMVLCLSDDRPLDERMAEHVRDFVLGDGETLAGALDAYDAVARRTAEELDKIADSGRRSPSPKECPGSRTTWRPGTSGGCCSTWWRRRPATPVTPTSCGSRSTAPRCTSSWPPPKAGRPPTGSNRGSRPPPDAFAR